MEGEGNSLTFSVFDATNDAALATFTISVPSVQYLVGSFAVEPSTGDIFVAGYNGTDNVSRWHWDQGSNTATKVWSSQTTNLATGAIYGYRDSTGAFRLGVVVWDGVLPDHTGAFSDVFDTASGARLPTRNSISGGYVSNALSHGNDLVSYTSSALTIWDSTATKQLLAISSNLPNDKSIQFSGVNEEADGTIVIADYDSRIMHFLDSTGLLLGSISADAGAGDPLDFVNAKSPVEVVNGRIYYNAENSFQAVPSKLTYFSTDNARAYLKAPQKIPFGLGVGAAITVPGAAKGSNYFTPGSTPQVNIQFSQWWSQYAGSFAGSYTVRSIQQVKANQAVAPTSFAVPTASYASGLASVPVTLPSSSPGYYEVNVTLQKGGKTVAADCLGYSVGAPGSTLNFSTLPSGGDARGVALAYQLGQRIYRSQYNLPDCYQNIGALTTASTPNCSSEIDTDVATAAASAAKLGVTYEIQLGTGNGLAADAANSSSNPKTYGSSTKTSNIWYQAVKKLAAHFPQVKAWECWNEPDNSYGDGANYVAKVLRPCYDAVKDALGAASTVVGISNESYTVGNYQQYIDAGALKYLDVVAVHTYSGHNRSFEEQGTVVPTRYNTTETGSLQQLQSYLASKGYTTPVWVTEQGFWQKGTDSYYTQGDKAVRAWILEQSTGVTKHANFYNEGDYSVDGANWALVGGSSPGQLNPGGLAAAVFGQQIGGRTFRNWLATNIPHTYAALYGPSSTDPGTKVAVWSDDYAAPAVAWLSGEESTTITDEWGNPTTLPFNGKVTLGGSVQYIDIPPGQIIRVLPQAKFGTNYAAASQGATASASSSWDCGGFSLTPERVIDGVTSMQGVGDDCDTPQNSLWIASVADKNPNLTIKLAQAQQISRVYVSSQGIGSVQTGLRSYDLQVDNGSGTFTTVAQVRDQFFDRDKLVSFPSQTVQRIRITNMSVNYSGYGDGLPPTTWPADYKTQNALWAGQATVYAVEAYS